jgi:hypothetical protein
MRRFLPTAKAEGIRAEEGDEEQARDIAQSLVDRARGEADEPLNIDDVEWDQGNSPCKANSRPNA